METESSKVTPPVTVPASAVSARFSQRRALSITSFVLGALLLLVVSFSIGFSAGLQKARFSYRFGENYERNFMKSERKEMKEKMLRKMDGKLFRSGHGVAGQVVSVTESSIVLQGIEGQENTVTLSETTVIMKGMDKVSVSDLESGDKLVVIGKPGEDGTVKADIIRVFPPDMDPGTGPIRTLLR